MADQMTRNVFGVVAVSVWHVLMTVVMFPSLLIQWLTGTSTTKPTPRKKMSENGQAKNGNADGPITENELKSIQDSWEVLAQNKKFSGVKFFIKLFTMYPDSKSYFKQFVNVPLEDLDYDEETPPKNKKIVPHAMSVMYALESYIDSLDDMDCLEELVRKVAHTHKRRNIGPDQFKLLTPVLHAVFEDLEKDGKLDLDLQTVKSGWKKLMEKVVSIVADAQQDD